MNSLCLGNLEEEEEKPSCYFIMQMSHYALIKKKKETKILHCELFETEKKSFSGRLSVENIFFSFLSPGKARRYAAVTYCT